jgi:glycosyltransferase involved in cell wall biosynthesis
MGLSRARIRRFNYPGRLTVRFEAEFSHRHSFGHVSRELALSLLERREIDLRLQNQGPADMQLESEERFRPLLRALDPNPAEGVDFHIRHHWPPNFQAPPSGRWILAQPWEYGNLPLDWVTAFRDKVDDVWCFTRYVKDAFERAGFPDNRTPIIPHGIDADIFRPDVDPLPLPTGRTFKFLYVGGTLPRKGADILLEAYLRTFSRREDVALIVKDFGTGTFYQGKTIHEEFLKAMRDGTRPEIVYMDGYLSEADVCRLYRACDVLVAPYRGEGFALTVLEAMASGLHVIATGGGATDDYVDGSCGSRIIANKKEGLNSLSDGTQCVAPLFFMEPDIRELERLMRWSFEHRELGKRLGQAASKRARSCWTWDQAAERIVARLQELSKRPILRLQRPLADDYSLPLRAKPPSLPASTQGVDTAKLAAIASALNNGSFGKDGILLEELSKLPELAEELRPIFLLAQNAFFPDATNRISAFSSKRKRKLSGLLKAALRGQSNFSRPPAVPSPQRVSLTMIVRNEEENIAECLNSVRNIVDEMVVVDTGSEDRTRVIAAGLGAKIFDFPWVDHFARARNEALTHATGDWIFWLDADDRIDEVNRLRLKQVFATLPSNRIVCYSMKVECVAAPGASPTVVDHVRAFPRHSGIRWEYRVHENILPSINRLGGEVCWTDVTIQHVGYLDERLREKKRLRDQNLLLKNLEDAPDDPFVHFNFGHSLIEGEDLDRAAFHLRESIRRSEPHYSQVKKAYALLAQVERNRGDLNSALNVLTEGRAHYPSNPELLYFSGIYLHEAGRLKEAADYFEQILKTKAWPQEFSSYDIGILDHKSRHRLAKVRLDMGDRIEAKAILSEIKRSHPDYIPAAYDLTRLYIADSESSHARGLFAELRAKGFLIEALFLEAELLKREGRHEEAMSSYAQVLEMEFRHEEACRALLELSCEIGEYTMTFETLRKRAQANHRRVESQYDLAKFIFERAHDSERGKALREVDRALEICADHVPSRQLRARIVDSMK